MNIQRGGRGRASLEVEERAAPDGSIIVIDPRTGEILAVLLHPHLHPLTSRTPASADMNLRVVTDAYEPGRSSRPSSRAWRCDRASSTPTPPSTSPPNVPAGDDWSATSTTATTSMTMTVREILRRSSNTGMVLVGQKIGADDFAEYLDRVRVSAVDAASTSPARRRGTSASATSTTARACRPCRSARASRCAPVPSRAPWGPSPTAGWHVHAPLRHDQARHGEEVDWSDGETRTISRRPPTCRHLDDGNRRRRGHGFADGAIDGYDVAGKTGTAERADESGGYREPAIHGVISGLRAGAGPEGAWCTSRSTTPRGPRLPTWRRLRSVMRRRSTYSASSRRARAGRAPANPCQIAPGVFLPPRSTSWALAGPRGGSTGLRYNSRLKKANQERAW